MKYALKLVESRSEKVEINSPQDIDQIVKWQNKKLHQLMAVKEFLGKNEEELPLEKVFERELEDLVKEENTFPQLRKQNQSLQK